MAANETGSCSVTPGSATVTFTSANLGDMSAGDLFRVILDSVFYEIASVDSTNNTATLTSRYSNSDYQTSITNEQFDTGDGTNVYSGTLLNIPVIPGTIEASDGSDQETFTDNGDGTLTGDAGGSGTANYDTGVISLTFNSNVSVGVGIYADEYDFGVTIGSTSFQVVRDYTPHFGWPEPHAYDQSPENITRRALRDIDNDLNTHTSKHIAFALYEDDTSVEVGDGKASFVVPYYLNGYIVSDVIAGVHTKGVTGTTDIQVRRRRDGTNADMLSTKVTLGDDYYARDGTVGSNNTLQTGDHVYVDVDSIHSGTAPLGLSVSITVSRPES